MPAIITFFDSRRAATSVHASLNSPMSFEAALCTQWPLGLKTMALSNVNLTCSREFEVSGYKVLGHKICSLGSRVWGLGYKVLDF